MTITGDKLAGLAWLAETRPGLLHAQESCGSLLDHAASSVGSELQGLGVS